MKKILVVDDDKDILEILKIILEEHKFSVETVNNVRMLQKKLTNGHQPDLIILDYLLPETNGIEIAKKLREQEKTKKIPIIIISAIMENIDHKNQKYIDEFLRKPFNLKEFISIVEKHTAQPHVSIA